MQTRGFLPCVRRSWSKLQTTIFLMCNVPPTVLLPSECFAKPSYVALSQLSQCSVYFEVHTKLYFQHCANITVTAVFTMGAIARSFGVLLPALLLTQAVAQIQFTNSHYDGITEGQPFNLTFAGDGSVSGNLFLTHHPNLILTYPASIRTKPTNPFFPAQPVTIYLKQGPASNLITISTIACKSNQA